MEINIVGDICMHNITNDNFSIDENIERIFESADCNIANLESPITESEERLKYQPIYLKGFPVDTKIFNCFDVFSLANNHVMDYSSEGLYDTIDFLEKREKLFFGAGSNADKAFIPAIIEKGNVKIAIFGFTRYNTAGKKTAGTAPVDKRKILSIIKEYKQNGFFVIVYPHWNYQWVDYPSPDERRFAKKMIKGGADLIIGAHPHIVQGFENYKGKMIYHSLGNFVFKRTKYSKPSEKLGNTFILQLKIADDYSYTSSIVPVFSDSPGLRLMNNDESCLFKKHLNEISKVFLSKNGARAAFYRMSKFIDLNTSFVFDQVRKESGTVGVLMSYKIATFQDIKKKLYSLLSK